MSETRYYDFTHVADREEILAYYGGLENMKMRYPFMYESFLNACNTHSLKSDLQEEKDGYISKVQAHYLLYDRFSNEYESAGNAILTSSAIVLQGVIEIFKNGERIAADTRLFHDTQYCYLKLDNPEHNYKESDEVYLKITAIWSTKNKILRACSVVKTLDLGEYEYIEQYENIHPKKQNRILKDIITVVYGRRPAILSCDYMYPESRDRAGYEKVSLQLEGDVRLKTGWTFKKEGNYEISLWSLEKGVLEYKGGRPTITKTDNGFHYKFPVKLDSTGLEYCEWNVSIPDSVMYGNRDYDFTLRFPFSVTDGTNKEIQQVVTTSSLGIKYPPVNYQVIPPIRLQWGCIGKNSLVLMADGSTKAISLIQVGDIIKDNNHSDAVVTNIFVGHEEEIMHVETQDGVQIDVCENHPLMTTEGYIPAKLLTAKTKVIMADGKAVGINYAYYEKYGDNVYSISLEKSSTGFIANDFIVGTFETENSLEDTTKKLDVDVKILEEIKRIEEDFHYVGVNN